MSNTIRIKRSTSTAAPTSLQNAEIAYSEASDKFFIGVGTGGVGGSATSIVAIGGKGAFADLLTDQSIGGTKTFTTSPVLPTPSTADDSTKGATTAFVKAQSYLTTGSASTTYAPINSPTFTGTVTIPNGASIAGFAPLASPDFSGVPTVPTATAGTNTTQAASTAFVQTAISNLVDAAPAALDTLNELAAALNDDANFSTTVATSIGTKLSKSSNLSDLVDVPTARTNLGLGTIATQNANNVAITGGTIDNITIDGGTF